MTFDLDTCQMTAAPTTVNTVCYFSSEFISSDSRGRCVRAFFCGSICKKLANSGQHITALTIILWIKKYKHINSLLKNISWRSNNKINYLYFVVHFLELIIAKFGNYTDVGLNRNWPIFLHPTIITMTTNTNLASVLLWKG